MLYGNFEFKSICGPNPEQYNVFDENGTQVGYVRLRWGMLTCEYRDVGGMIIYEHKFANGGKGCFDNQTERNIFLEDIAASLNKFIKKSHNTNYEKDDGYAGCDNVTVSICGIPEIGW